jgi:protein-tyrosine-phosphatase
MKVAARTVGEALEGWSSRTLDLENLESWDLIVLFDLDNFARYKKLRRRNPNVLMCGLLAAEGNVEIDDPYGRGEPYAVLVARQIQASVTGLSVLIGEKQPNG